VGAQRAVTPGKVDAYMLGFREGCRQVRAGCCFDALMMRRVRHLLATVPQSCGELLRLGVLHLYLLVVCAGGLLRSSTRVCAGVGYACVRVRASLTQSPGRYDRDHEQK
jgi:hypothetical protein